MTEKMMINALIRVYAVYRPTINDEPLCKCIFVEVSEEAQYCASN